jgi:hypothetical protein
VLSVVYGREAMKKSCAFEWHRWFKEGCENMEDYERSDHPRFHRTDENVENVWKLVHSDRRLSINQAYYVEY